MLGRPLGVIVGTWCPLLSYAWPLLKARAPVNQNNTGRQPAEQPDNETGLLRVKCQCGDTIQLQISHVLQVGSEPQSQEPSFHLHTMLWFVDRACIPLGTFLTKSFDTLVGEDVVVTLS